MTQIDFHTNIADIALYGCRLVRKANSVSPASRITVFLRHDQINDFDRLLWTFSPQDFLAHAIEGEEAAEKSKIILSANGNNLPQGDILINLSGEMPQSFAQFERMFEIVSRKDGDVISARERYSYYRQRGYSLTHKSVG